MTEQRCTVMVKRVLGDSGGITWCNLPIEGYGPCATRWYKRTSMGPCGYPEDAPIHEGDTSLEPHHPYQPSQWRHIWDGVPDGPTELGRSNVGHEAKP